jgi:CMP-N-acetylneuraminic acid synthetase
MNVVAVIPARGGSQGVRAKNLRQVGGVSLVARAVIAARSSLMIDRVIVSTDDAAIALEATSAGAEIVERPAGLANDTATSESALLHALDSLDEPVDVLVFLQATSPFIDVAALEVAIARVLGGVHDVVFSVVESHSFLWTADAGGVNHDPRIRQRRQDREPQFRETGAFYVLRAAGFRASRHRFFGSVGLAPVDDRTALEIDTEVDLDFANAIAASIDGRLGSRIDEGIDTEEWEESWSYPSAAGR